MTDALQHLLVSGKVVDSDLLSDRGKETFAAARPNCGKVMPQSLVGLGMVILPGLVDFGTEMAPGQVDFGVEKPPSLVDFDMAMPRNRFSDAVEVAGSDALQVQCGLAPSQYLPDRVEELLQQRRVQEDISHERPLTHPVLLQRRQVWL